MVQAYFIKYIGSFSKYEEFEEQILILNLLYPVKCGVLPTYEWGNQLLITEIHYLGSLKIIEWNSDRYGSIA